MTTSLTTDPEQYPAQDVNFFIFLNFHRSGSVNPFPSRREHPEILKSRIVVFVRNPDSPSPIVTRDCSSAEIQDLQISQKFMVFKSARNPGSSNPPEIQGL